MGSGRLKRSTQHSHRACIVHDQAASAGLRKKEEPAQRIPPCLWCEDAQEIAQIRPSPCRHTLLTDQEEQISYTPLLRNPILITHSSAQNRNHFLGNIS